MLDFTAEELALLYDALVHAWILHRDFHDERIQQLLAKLETKLKATHKKDYEV